MGNFIIKTGDSLMVTFTIPTPAVVPTVSLVGTGTDVLVDGMPICLPGDIEQSVALAGPLPYTAGPYIIPGTGKLTLEAPVVTALTLSGGSSPIVIQGTRPAARAAGSGE